MTSQSSALVVGSAFLCVLFLLTGFPRGVWSQSNPASSSTRVLQSFECPNGTVYERPQICPSKVNNTLYVLGFVPATNGVFESDNIIPAAYAALDEINANCSILENYTLQIDFVNTECNPSEATWQLIDSIILSNTPRKITFLGGGCSLATEPVAALSGRFYNIPQISYGASSPSLSQERMFPRFVRTIPSEIQANMARFALMSLYNWSRVATLHETQTIFSLAVNDFHQRYDIIYNTTAEDLSEEEENLIPRSFTDDPEIPLNQIMEREIRIIFGYFYEDKASTVVCQAIRNGLFSNNHFWTFPAWFTFGWWDKPYNQSDGELSCTREEMNRAVNLSFFLDSYNYGLDRLTMDEINLFTESNSTQFDEKYGCYNNEFRTNPATRNLTRNDSRPHIYRTFSYDAVYVIADSLHKTQQKLEEERMKNPNFNLTLEDFAYFDENNISMTITDFMKSTDFEGITGRVRFDVNGTRLGLNAIYQLVLPPWEQIKDKDTISGDYTLLAVHNPYEGFNVTNDSSLFNKTINYIREPLWKSGHPPTDRRTPKNKYLSTDFVSFCQAFTAIAMVVVVALIVFNNVTLFKPLIRDSAPHINTVILVGCLMMLMTCYLLSVDTANPPVNDRTKAPDSDLTKDQLGQRNSRYGKVCMARLWLLTIAFTLSFGALFAKTWQVYRVYTNPKLQKEPFKMWNFLIFMAVFLVIDVAYLLFWTLAYPFTRMTVMSKDDSNDVENIFEMCQCNFFPYLIGALYVYKGLLVVFGLFLAYESRNVKYYYINDSRFVSISMYIVVILVGIGAPLSLVLAVHNFIDPAYGLAVFMIIASTMSCVLILYIPKFVFIAQGKDTMVRENAREEVTVSDGLQLGRTTMDQTEVRTVEEEVTQLKEENEKRDQEIRHLENGVEIKPRTGSDGDSGVLVMTDENEVFSTESTANGDAHHRTLVTTPSSGDDEGTEGPITVETA